MEYSKLLFYILVIFSMTACAQATSGLPVHTPSKAPLLVTPAPTSTTIRTDMTVTPIPTQLAGILKHWREYEIALAQSMIPSYASRDEVICEWEVLGESDNALYVWAACTATVPVPQSDDQFTRIHDVAVIHLGEDSEALYVERPRGGTFYASDIREMFPVDVQEKCFSKAYDYQRLTDHLVLRRDNAYMSPLVVLDAARLTHTPTSTFIKTDFPEGLMVAFIADDTLQVWKEGELQKELISRSSIFSPSLSYDGEWVMFYQKVNQDHPRNEIWAVRSDGSDLHRLLSTDEIASLAESDFRLTLDEISWLPNNHQLVFNTTEATDGPPGYRPSYDLYLLDISGEITKLAGPGEGGDFYPSPDGRYLAASMPSRIGLFDLETGTYRSLLEFEAYIGPIGPTAPPVLYWDKNSQFITTTILPKYVYYPYEYSGEPEQIWRLGINGQNERIVEVDPLLVLGSAVRFSPHAEYYFYFEMGQCLDGAAWIIHLRSLSTGKEILEIPCTFSMPEWSPDGEHFIYREEGKWILGTVDNTPHKHLEFLDTRKDEEDFPSVTVHWIDHFNFLEEVENEEECTIYLGSLDGTITEISHTNSSRCPGISYRLLQPSVCNMSENIDNNRLLHDHRIYWTDMGTDLWTRVKSKLNDNYPEFSNFHQSVYYQKLDKAIEYDSALTIINQASGGGADPQFINPFIILVTVGENLNWEPPPDGDLYHYSKAVRDTLLGHFREYEWNADIRSQNPNINNAATYMIYTYYESDLENIENWCKSYLYFIGQDPAISPFEE